MNWIINSCRKTGIHNEKKMLEKNIFYIGFGIPEEQREKKNSNTTFKQFNSFINKAQINDKIYLYANKIGIIAIGHYTGKFYIPMNDELAPDWNINEKQYCIKIDKWNYINKPIKYIARPLTLYLEKKNIE